MSRNKSSISLDSRPDRAWPGAKSAIVLNVDALDRIRFAFFPDSQAPHEHPARSGRIGAVCHANTPLPYFQHYLRAAETFPGETPTHTSTGEEISRFRVEHPDSQIAVKR